MVGEDCPRWITSLGAFNHLPAVAIWPPDLPGLSALQRKCYYTVQIHTYSVQVEVECLPCDAVASSKVPAVNSRKPRARRLSDDHKSL